MTFGDIKSTASFFFFSASFSSFSCRCSLLSLPVWLDVKTPVEIFFFFYYCSHTQKMHTHILTFAHTQTHANTDVHKHTKHTKRHCSSQRPARTASRVVVAVCGNGLFFGAWLVTVKIWALSAGGRLVSQPVGEASWGSSSNSSRSKRDLANRGDLRCSTPWGVRAQPSQGHFWCSPPAHKNRRRPCGPLMAAAPGHQWEWAERSCRDKRSSLRRNKPTAGLLRHGPSTPLLCL